MSNTCPCCLKTNVKIHTCTPTPFVRKIKSERDAALAMVRELVDAVKPFAKFGKKLDGRRGTPVSGDWYSLDSGSEGEASITIEDFNGAINALTKAEALNV